MVELVDTDFDALTVETLRAFLDAAEEEGLIWEAKSEFPRSAQVQKAVCGFANSVGRYLIIGASPRAREELGWDLDGFESDCDEPGTRIVQMIAPDGVAPVPRCAHKTFSLEEGRKCVVVRIEPVDAPPCITSSGIVYQRVSGATNPVRDQGTLSKLISQGQLARTTASERARDAARRVLDWPGEPEAAPPADFTPIFAMGICAVGGLADQRRILFQLSRAEAFWKLVHEQLRFPGIGQGAHNHGADHASLRAWNASIADSSVNTAMAFRDGSAAIGFAASSAYAHGNSVSENFENFWRTLVNIMRLFGNVGDAYIVLVFALRAVGAFQPDWPQDDLARWTEVRNPSQDELAGVRREITRAFGAFAWEPESPS